MSGRVLRFEGSVHNQAMRLLPWFVNGTLLAEEFDLVCKHVAGCSECRREVDELRRLQDICARVESPNDATASFARLKRRLQHDHAEPASRWDRLRSHWMQAPTWFRVTLATQSCVLFALAGVLFGQQYSAVRSVEPASLYRTLGDTVPGGRSISASDVRLVVMFDPRISHAEMQRLLRLSRARIIDGPNDAGAYVLAVPANGEKAALDALRSEPGVALVQRLDRGEAGDKR